jgi:hypothetical protein
MSDINLQELLITCQGLNSEQKAELLKVLLGERNINVTLSKETILSTDSIPKLLNAVADSLVSSREGGRLSLSFIVKPLKVFDEVSTLG